MAPPRPAGSHSCPRTVTPTRGSPSAPVTTARTSPMPPGTREGNRISTGAAGPGAASTATTASSGSRRRFARNSRGRPAGTGSEASPSMSVRPRAIRPRRRATGCVPPAASTRAKRQGSPRASRTWIGCSRGDSRARSTAVSSPDFPWTCVDATPASRRIAQTRSEISASVDLQVKAPVTSVTRRADARSSPSRTRTTMAPAAGPPSGRRTVPRRTKVAAAGSAGGASGPIGGTGAGGASAGGSGAGTGAAGGEAGPGAVGPSASRESEVSMNRRKSTRSREPPANIALFVGRSMAPPRVWSAAMVGKRRARPGEIRTIR